MWDSEEPSALLTDSNGFAAPGGVWRVGVSERF